MPLLQVSLLLRRACIKISLQLLNPFIHQFYALFSYTFPASCCNEALKIATSAAPYLNNYFMLIGTEGVYSFTFEHERKPDCPVCGDNSKPATLSSDMTVEELLDWLLEKQDM